MAAVARGEEMVVVEARVGVVAKVVEAGDKAMQAAGHHPRETRAAVVVRTTHQRSEGDVSLCCAVTME